jgi:uncharacterized protein (TIGR00299 family) protein
MKTLYLDIFSGISGDMFIAALIDLGVSEHQIKYKVAELGLDGYKIEVARKEKSGIAGVKFDVILEGRAAHGHVHPHAHEALHEHTPVPRRKSKSGASPILNATFTKFNPARVKLQEARREYAAEHAHDHQRNYLDICELINNAKLSPWVKEKAVAVFHRIAVAEGKIHGKPPEEVHFHEVGAVDSIVDIVGACIGLEILGRPRVLAGNVQEGTGWLRCAHGRFPIPAPATMGILSARGVSITQTDEPNELVTPTGAALLAEFVESFGPMQGIVVEKIGFGLGTRNNLTRPNVLRAVLGESVEPTNDAAQAVVAPRKAAASLPQAAPQPTTESALDWETDTIAVLETNLDDINAELLGAFLETALAAGALDVFHTPIQMKKNRPGVLLTVLCAEADADRFTELLLRETSAFGVRRTLSERRKLAREFVTVATAFGEVTVKLGRLGGEVIQAAPEYESCRQAAASASVPVKRVYEAALRALEPAQ